MFSTKKILSITKDKVIAIEVLDPVSKKFGRSFEFGWEVATLDLALMEAAKRFNDKKFRILVSDDLSYVVRIQIPPEIKQEGVKKFILEKLQEKIPDTINEGEWDYKELRGTGDTKDVIAFVLVKKFAIALFTALEKSGVQADAIESVTIAKTRDANAYVGLALKEDLKGKDEDVLNISPQEVTNLPVPAPATQAETTGTKASRSRLKLILFLIPVILLGILFGGFFYLKNNVTKENISVESSPESSVSPSETSAPTSTPSAPLDLGSLKVQVQNGSGTPGESAAVASLLEPAGFKNIETGNAESFGFTDTEVRLKDKIDTVFEVIERALNQDYSVVKSEGKLEENDEFDVIVIVGKRK